MNEESEEKMTVQENFYVNEATLDLLRRRIESDVKRGFFRSVGLPVGGAGIVAILFFLFYWGPRTIQDYLTEDPDMQKQLQQTVLETTQEYLKDAKRGQQVIGGHVGSTTLSYLQDEERGQKVVEDLVHETVVANLQRQVAAYFESKEGKEFLRQRLAAETKGYFGTDSGSKQLQKAVQAGLGSDEVQSLITQTISEAVRPFASKVQQSLSQHKDDVVTDILRAEVKQDPEGFDVVELPGGATKRVSLARVGKAGVPELMEFLNSPEAEKMAESGKPMALTFHMFSRMQYAGSAMDYYLNMLKERFGDQFKYCLILGREGRFVALARVEELAKVLSGSQRGQFVDLLNAPEDRIKLQDARRKVNQMLGSFREPIELRENLTIWEALHSPAWLPLLQRGKGTNLDDGLPLVDASGSFEGVLTRGHLIAGLLRG